MATDRGAFHLYSFEDMDRVMVKSTYPQNGNRFGLRRRHVRSSHIRTKRFNSTTAASLFHGGEARAIVPCPCGGAVAPEMVQPR
jgi:hypothetical protein